jgi:hypothetical protein
MLEQTPRRPKTPSAIRSAELRARRRKGIRRDLKVRVVTKRLVKAMLVADPCLHEDQLVTIPEIEAELKAVVEEFITKWIGGKIPNV